MKKDKRPRTVFLRQKAEELLKKKSDVLASLTGTENHHPVSPPSHPQENFSEAKLLKLRQELEIYRIELDMQHDELLFEKEQANLQEEYREMNREVFQILIEQGNLNKAVTCIIDVLKSHTGFDAVGIRLKDGDDFPYYAQQGFSKDFLRTENSLTERDKDGGLCRDKDGNINLECTCGLIISGKTDPSNALFTQGGSAWTNDSSHLLQLTPGGDPRYHPRNRCIHQGFASVALIPIRNNNLIVGLIQFNDHRKGCFSLAVIEIMEDIASHIGEALMRKQAEAALKESEENFRSFFDQNAAAIAIIEPDTTISMVNEQYCRMSGYTKQEVVGMSWIKQIPPGDLDRLKEYNRRRLQNLPDAPDNYEFTFFTKNGELKYAFMSITMLQNQRMIASFVDITARKLEEAEYRMRGEILEKMEESVLLVRASDETIAYANPNVDAAFGYHPGGLTGKHISILVAPTEKSPAEIVKDIVQQININNFWLGEAQNIRKNGTICWGLFHISSFKHSQYGNVWILIRQDITGQKQAEQEKQISEEKYRTMLNSSPDGILIINMQGIITEVSEIGLELFGADSKDDLVGSDFIKFVPPDARNTVKEIIEKTTNEGLAQNVGLKIRKKNQSLFASETSATLIQGSDGAPLAFMIIIRDVSHRQKRETKQIHADRMANLGEMATGIAHEINQPLNIISMVLDKILFESAKTEAIDLEFFKLKANRIFENITRIRNIIDHIRSFSRSNEDFVPTAFDINASIENAVSMTMEQFKHLGISLNLELGKQLPPILGNTFQFEQVIVNLLVNAKDAVIDRKNKQEELYDMVVGINSYQGNKCLVVEVSDNGIGIENDDLHNIILPFYTTKEEGKGTGLGLTICYQIMKEMNGTIDITSERMTGTTIKLVLDFQEKM